MTISTWVQVAAGGAIGATLRFAAQGAALRLLGSSFPLGTLAVNVTGSLLMGLLAALLLARPEMARLQPLLMTGILGGFTTFSAFSLDTLALVQRGETGKALAYVIASVALSLLGVLGGYALGRSL
jgi:CrcB protein